MTKREQPTVVRTFQEAREAFIDEDEIALDLETSGFSPWKNRIHVITLYGPKSNTIAILHYGRNVSIPEKVFRWLEEFRMIVTHNGTMFDWLFLANAGMDWRKPQKYDTLTGELAVLEVARRDYRVNLQDTAKRRLGVVIDKEIDHGSWQNDELDEIQIGYVTGDIAHLIDMKREQESRALDRGTLESLAFEQNLTNVVIEMELNGLPIDVSAIATYFDNRHEQFQITQDYLIANLGTINFNSHVQLKAALNRLHPDMFPDTKKETFQERIILGGAVEEMCNHILFYKNYVRRQMMYSPEWRAEHIVHHMDGIPRVHGKFWQIGTNTGRFSSSQPNLQQIPRDMRMVYGNAPGYVILKADYSAIEVRVAAALSKDVAMIEAFNAGIDIHTFVASIGFNKPMEEVTKAERQIAKAMSFTLIFGGSVQTFINYARNNGSTIDMITAEKAVAAFYERFQGIYTERLWAEELVAKNKATKLTFPTGLKRLIAGPEHKSTTILNNEVQGTAAAGIKFALMHARHSGIAHYLAAVVHDEALAVVPERDVEEVRHELVKCMVHGMQDALQGRMPISIGVESSISRNVMKRFNVSDIPSS